jgi:hypothetical protein
MLLMFKKSLFLLLAATGLNAQPYQSEFFAGTGNAPAGGGGSCNLLTNCSFETGDTTGWTITDLTTPFLPMQVVPDGADIGFGFFLSEATDGAFSLVNGFDGGGPGTIELAQDITLPSDISGISFDYRAAWDLQTFGATQDRTLTVEIQPSGGGGALQSDLILTAPVGNITNDTGPLSATVGVSAFAGQNVRLALIWNIPEFNTGPAFFQVDNFQGTFPPPRVPTLGIMGLALLGGLMIALTVLFRRKTQA